MGATCHNLWFTDLSAFIKRRRHTAIAQTTRRPCSGAPRGIRQGGEWQVCEDWGVAGAEGEREWRENILFFTEWLCRMVNSSGIAREKKRWKETNSTFGVTPDVGSFLRLSAKGGCKNSRRVLLRCVSFVTDIQTDGRPARVDGRSASVFQAVAAAAPVNWRRWN